MTVQTCGTCKWHQEYIEGDEDEPSIHLCRLPEEQMPICMQGYGQREKRPV